jgi:hypothetical protein
VLNKGLLQRSPLFFSHKEAPMAKVIIHLKEGEHSALHKLALREYRTLPAQAAIIIHQQLQTLGLLPGNGTSNEISTDQMLQNPTEV